jgi:hypothetical protein
MFANQLALFLLAVVFACGIAFLLWVLYNLQLDSNRRSNKQQRVTAGFSMRRAASPLDPPLGRPMSSRPRDPIPLRREGRVFREARRAH